MKKFLIILLFLTSILSAKEGINLLTTEMVEYRYTATSSLGLKDADIDYTLPGIIYFYMDKNYIALASVKYSKRQRIGQTALGTTDIGLVQKGWKYELGAGYKYFLTEKFYIGPALLFSDAYTELDQIVGTNRTRTKKHDADLRFYGLFGYNITKATMIFGAVELDNDLLSNEYYRDFSGYTTSVTLYQFLSKDFFFYLKYEQALKDKKSTATVIGNKDYIGYGFGIGTTF